MRGDAAEVSLTSHCTVGIERGHARGVAARVREDASPALRGVFHMTGSGEVTWAEFAEAIFVEAAARGRGLTRVKHITTSDYPTPAPRPANSRLDNEKLRRVCRLELPDWRKSLKACCVRLIP